MVIDAIKSSYRQTKDGFAITFVLHPQDDHDELARAPIGSQWQMQLVPLDENGNANTDVTEPPPAVRASVKEAETIQPACGIAASASRSDAGSTDQPANAGALAPAREAGSVPSQKIPASRLTKLACICCNDPVFWRYLSELGYDVTDRDEARDAIYGLCNVESRKEFIIGTPAGDRWIEFYDQFAIWRDVPEPEEV